MASINSSDWCVWGNVSGLYSNLSLCTEEISDCLLIPWPNPLVEQTFVNIHSRFFKDCPTEELSDPPPVIVFALVITPICLIPIMVSLVVLKTKNGDGSSWKSWICAHSHQEHHIFNLRSPNLRTITCSYIRRCCPFLSPVTLHRTSSPVLHNSSSWDISHRGDLWRKWHWLTVNVIICGITSIAAA